jgi:peptidoglycan/LPS O-acetylase OafA/YrhL
VVPGRGERFYLPWPLAQPASDAFRKRPDRLFITMLTLALVSTVLMALLYHPVDPSLVYYGTDTRIGGLMLGCCLALFWHPRQLQAGIPPVKPRAVAAAGILGTVGLALLCVLCTERGAFLYRGGFLLVDVATIAVSAAVAHRACASAAGSASRSSSTSACGPTASTSGTGPSSP